MYSKDRLAEILISTNCVKFGEFILSSGVKSNVYVDMRKIISHPAEFMELIRIYAGMVSNLKFDILAGVESGGIPFATAIGVELKKPIIYVRKEYKNHGLKKLIEGEYKERDIALVIDDVSTTGSSIARAVEVLELNNLIVYDAFVIVDRGEGAREKLQQLNIKLHYLITLEEILSLVSHQASISHTKEIRGERHE